MDQQGSFLSEWDSQDTEFSTFGLWKNLRMHIKIPLHSPQVTDLCGFMATFIIEPFFFEEITAPGIFRCYDTERHHHDMLQMFVVSQLQQRHVLISTIFMQYGAFPHIHVSLKAQLTQNFTDKCVISRFFPRP